MKTLLSTAAKLIGGAALLLAASNAMAGHVNVGISIGVPGVYVQPAPVYVQPAPVYVEPRPVYVERVYERPVYREPVYVEPVYVRPRPVVYFVGHERRHGWHRHHGYGYR